MTEQKKALTLASANSDKGNTSNNTPVTGGAKVSVITSQRPKTLTKRFSLKDGQLNKETAANLYKGIVEVVEVKDAQELGKLIGSLGHDQALCYGLPVGDARQLVTKTAYEEAGRPATSLPRAKEHFNWPDGGGVMLLDHDKPTNGGAFDRDRFFKVLSEVIPDFDQIAKTWIPSSSSLISNSDTGEQLIPLKGHHTNIIVKDATDIPRAGKVIFDRLWLAGYGFYEVSTSGQLLPRTPVDASMWQTNKLDFAAGSRCTAPLKQLRGEPRVYDGVPLDTRELLPDLTIEEEQQLKSLKEKAKAEMAGEVQETQALYIHERSSQMVGSNASAEEIQQAEKTVLRALEQKVLTGDFEVILEGGEVVTIGDMLDDPMKYHHKLTFDPLEPDYDGGRVVGKLYLIGSRPNLHSFAHGGKTYRLVRQPREIEVIQGRTHDTVQETLALMRVLPDVFDYGDALVTIHQGRAHPLNEAGLAHYLGGVCQYWKWVVRGEQKIKVLADPPPNLVKQILALEGQRELKKLDAVITAPVMMPDGYIVNKIGYNEQSRLLLDSSEILPAVPREPSKEQVQDAVQQVMKPFNEFPYCESIDKAALLAAVLTGIVRAVLPTAPAFAFDAPTQGSGKTLLAKCVASIATGGSYAVWPHTRGRDDEETRKRIGTALLSGERAIIWDNILGDFDSASIAALLTSEVYSDRTLGKSHAPKLPNKALFLMTGNNLSLAGDMPRRVIVCRIDPQSERPYARTFDLDPLEYIKRNRQQIVTAGLTIMRGYMADEFHDKAEGQTASFEVWDELVRQPIAWLNEWICEGEFGDIMQKVDEAQQKDPEKAILGELLRALYAQFSSQPFMAKDVEKHTTRDVGLHFEQTEIGECLDEILGGRNLKARSIGKVLSNREGRIVDGFVLERATNDSYSKSARFKVTEVAKI
ncbi:MULTISPECIES: hypothetical protein [Idiomarina]|jgi:hypothetical protein|nr:MULTISPECIES: hypothetical protein [Idiomarina]MAC32090.1 hypothetical protein [Haliea sp.]MAO68149.1 hypothetical protein [Idiomarina sp.]MBF79901.1 hypothetical protein [Idiomarina sp.]|tara:strand:+ start:3002 stop:5770 length:2769 start_codon:yes stop_codon:yes gene_type:complete